MYLYGSRPEDGIRCRQGVKPPLNSTQLNLCQGKGARPQRAKNRTEPFPGKIGRRFLNLVGLALINGDGVVQKSVRKGLERKKERTKEGERGRGGDGDGDVFVI